MSGGAFTGAAIFPFLDHLAFLENELHSQDHAADSAAELLRLQERGIRWQHVTLRRKSCGDPRSAEYVAVA